MPKAIPYAADAAKPSGHGPAVDLRLPECPVRAVLRGAAALPARWRWRPFPLRGNRGRAGGYGPSVSRSDGAKADRSTGSSLRPRGSTEGGWQCRAFPGSAGQAPVGRRAHRVPLSKSSQPHRRPACGAWSLGRVKAISCSSIMPSPAKISIGAGATVASRRRCLATFASTTKGRGGGLWPHALRAQRRKTAKPVQRRAPGLRGHQDRAPQHRIIDGADVAGQSPMPNRGTRQTVTTCPAKPAPAAARPRQPSA